MAGYSEFEQRIRHLEERLMSMEDALRDLADQVGQIAQNQNMMRPAAGMGMGQISISAVAATGGITAAPDADTLGQGNVILRRRDGAALTNGRTVLCYSNFSTAITAGTRLEVEPDGTDYKLVAADCPA